LFHAAFSSSILEIICEVVDRILASQLKVQVVGGGGALRNTVRNIHVPRKVKNVFSGYATISFN
jgi:uridylate kinase